MDIFEGGATKIQPAGNVNRIRGSNGLELQQRVPQGIRRISGNRAYSVWRLSDDNQRSAIEAVEEEEASAGAREESARRSA